MVTGTAAQLSRQIGLLGLAGVTKDSNLESGNSRWVTKNSANTESQAMENLANTENRVMQNSGGRKLEEGKGAAPSKRPALRWCPRGITKTQKCRL
jgi:hypothetical protein